jgi:hypothetical protein
MSIWYVTTGISLQEKSRCWQDSGLMPDFAVLDHMSSHQFEASQTGARLRTWLNEQLRAIEGSPNPCQAAENFVQQHFRAEAVQGLLPAELATLKALADQGALQEGDQLRFLGGVTNWAVAQVLKAAAKSLWPGLRVDLLGPYQLDPVNTGNFNTAVEQLWVKEIQSNLDRARFVLTGGYKALLLALAWRLSANWAVPRGVPVIYYLHEDPGFRLIQLGRGVEDRHPGEQRTGFAPLVAT